MLAPLALGAFVVVFLAIVLSSGAAGGGSESTGDGGRAASTTSAPRRERTSTQAKQPATYTVKVGDTLGSIAETTGVPVEKLLELNPDLDPQALVSGQKIKLRE
jgi:LysM repeat protein